MLRENEGWDKEGRPPIAHRRAVVTGGMGYWGHAPLQILANQLTLSQPGKTDYALHITT